NGTFVADGNGTCVVTGTGYDVSAKMTMSVGKKYVAVNSFEAARDLVMYYYPEGIQGSAETDTQVKYDGTSSIRIDYNFKANQT
ncbi:hypothetical protein RFY41_18825, partial [Acinetobacter soli]|uniref:hypothetical protein n=1 Tax=Acinetobacter soli TaxID=487316 RepID=UPI002812DE6A